MPHPLHGIGCRECAYWDSKDGVAGLCRYTNPNSVTDNQGNIKHPWPETVADDWCGFASILPTRMAIPTNPVTTTSGEGMRNDGGAEEVAR